MRKHQHAYAHRVAHMLEPAMNMKFDEIRRPPSRLIKMAAKFRPREIDHVVIEHGDRRNKLNGLNEESSESSESIDLTFARNDTGFYDQFFPNWRNGSLHSDQAFSEEFLASYDAWCEATSDYVSTLEAIAAGLICSDSTFLRDKLDLIEFHKRKLERSLVTYETF